MARLSTLLLALGAATGCAVGADSESPYEAPPVDVIDDNAMARPDAAALEVCLSGEGQLHAVPLQRHVADTALLDPTGRYDARFLQDGTLLLTHLASGTDRAIEPDLDISNTIGWTDSGELIIGGMYWMAPAIDVINPDDPKAPVATWDLWGSRCGSYASPVSTVDHHGDSGQIAWATMEGSYGQVGVIDAKRDLEDVVVIYTWDAPTDVELLDEGRVLATAGLNGLLQLWEVETGLELNQVRLPATSTSVVRDGDSLIVGDADGGGWRVSCLQ